MNITVNGAERKLNIGCRTFISITELLHILEVKQYQPVSVRLNGEIIHQQNLLKSVVSNGDDVTLLDWARRPVTQTVAK